MADKKLDIIEEIDGWGFTFTEVNDFFSNVSEADSVIIPINSYGGSVMEGTAIYNVIKGSKAQTTAHIVGYAMSMGTIIAMGADEIVMPENGYIMIHEPSMIKWGDSDTLENAAQFLDTIGMDAAKIYAKKTGKSPEEIRQMMKKTTWMNAQQALEMGFVDRLSAASEIHASLDPKEFTTAPAALLNKPKPDPDSKGILSQIGELVSSFMGQSHPGDDQSQKITDLESTNATLQAKLDKSVEQLAESANQLKTANESIETLKAANTALQNEINSLKDEPADTHPADTSGAEGNEQLKSYQKDAITQKAIRLHSKKTKD